MEAKNGILIVGGSGMVGAKIAENLAPDFPDRVIIAAQNLGEASQVASDLGDGVSARFIDVRQRQSIEAAMEGVGTIIGILPGISNVFARLGARKTYLFPFADQDTYPATLGAHTAVSRLGLLPQWGSELLTLLLLPLRERTKAQQSLAAGRLGELVQRRRQKYTGLDWWGVHVEVQGTGGMYRASLQGYGQRWATALSASTFARALLDGQVDRPGIWTADQVIPPRPYLKKLASHGLQPAYSYHDPVGPVQLSNVRAYKPVPAPIEVILTRR